MSATMPMSLPDVEARLAEAERVTGALRKIAEGLRELNGHAAEVLPPSFFATREPVVEPVEQSTFVSLSFGEEEIREAHPRGREAVRLIVASQPDKELWSLSEIVAEMQRREWFTSRKGAEVAVARLCNSGEAERTSKKGVYRFRRDMSEGQVVG